MNFEPITTQQVVDRLHEHFFEKKNPPGFGARGRCAYLGPDGSKCGVGCLMPDALLLYDGDIIAGSITSIRNAYPGIRDFFSNVDIHLLQSIQAAHDEAASASRKVDVDDPDAYFRSLFRPALRDIFKWNSYDVVLPEVFK